MLSVYELDGCVALSRRDDLNRFAEIFLAIGIDGYEDDLISISNGRLPVRDPVRDTAPGGAVDVTSQAGETVEATATLTTLSPADPTLEIPSSIHERLREYKMNPPGLVLMDWTFRSFYRNTTGMSFHEEPQYDYWIGRFRRLMGAGFDRPFLD